MDLPPFEDLPDACVGCNKKIEKSEWVRSVPRLDKAFGNSKQIIVFKCSDCGHEMYSSLFDSIDSIGAREVEK